MSPRTASSSSDDESAEPRRWCIPSTAFGKIDGVRKWVQPDPDEPNEVAKFRAAAMQNVIAVHVRRTKEMQQHGRSGTSKLSQEALALRDGRPDSLNKWNKKLNGRMNLTATDIATLAMILPGALPAEYEVRTFIEVVSGQQRPPAGFPWKDRPMSIKGP